MQKSTLHFPDDKSNKLVTVLITPRSTLVQIVWNMSVFVNFFQTQILNLLCVISALPPVKETRKPPEGLKPFKPSSPAKEVIKLNHLNEEFLRLIHVPDGSLLSFSRKGHYLTGLAFFQEGMLVHGCLNPVGLRVGNLKEFCDIQ